MFSVIVAILKIPLENYHTKLIRTIAIRKLEITLEHLFHLFRTVFGQKSALMLKRSSLSIKHYIDVALQ